MKSFTTTHSETNTWCFSECDYPVFLQISLGSLRPALLQHLGTVVQKGWTWQDQNFHAATWQDQPAVHTNVARSNFFTYWLGKIKLLHMLTWQNQTYSHIDLAKLSFHESLPTSTKLVWCLFWLYKTLGPFTPAKNGWAELGLRMECRIYIQLAWDGQHWRQNNHQSPLCW